jgi:hypothetical protein
MVLEAITWPLGAQAASHRQPPLAAGHFHRHQRRPLYGGLEINDLLGRESPAGHLYVKLKEMGIQVEREWWIDEEGTAYVMDLALPREGGWLPVSFGDRPGPAGGLRFEAEAEPDVCLREIQARLRTFEA